MIAKGAGRIVLAGMFGAVAMAACGDRIVDDGIPKGLGGQGGGGGSANTSCWPTDPACYGGNALLEKSPGGECLATRDNTPVDSNGIQHVQLRQNWVRATTPAGNTFEQNKTVYNALAGFSQLPWSACNNFGASGYIQLFDLALHNADNTGDAWIGFAKFVAKDQVPTVLQDGLCMVDDTWANDSYALNAPTPDPWATSTSWPAGLPKPMWRGATPWHVKPSHAKRVAADFDPKADRLSLLASFEPGGANEGYDGIFYYDATKGTSHGFSRLSYLVIYDNSTSYIAVPIREAETHSQFNDPTHPNCQGAFTATPANNCGPGATLDGAAWGCDTHNDCAGKAGEGPATTDGYFLITELEQIYANLLFSTLCVSYPLSKTTIDSGWTDSTQSKLTCRSSPKWNPSDPINGIPTGDWCAETNSPGDANCHDAYRSHSFHVFSAFPVKSPSQAADGGAITGTCTAL